MCLSLFVVYTGRVSRLVEYTVCKSRSSVVLFINLSLPVSEEPAHFKKVKQYRVRTLLRGLSSSPLPSPKNNFQPLFFCVYLKISHSLCVKICVSTHGLKSGLLQEAMPCLCFSHHWRKSRYVSLI